MINLHDVKTTKNEPFLTIVFWHKSWETLLISFSVNIYYV